MSEIKNYTMSELVKMQEQESERIEQLESRLAAAEKRVKILQKTLQDALERMETDFITIDNEWGDCRQTIEEVPDDELNDEILSARQALAELSGESKG